MCVFCHYFIAGVLSYLSEFYFFIVGVLHFLSEFIFHCGSFLQFEGGEDIVCLVLCSFSLYNKFC